MPASPIIEIKNLSAGYDNRTVLHDINLIIYERDFWASSVPTWWKDYPYQMYTGTAETHRRGNSISPLPPIPLRNCQLSIINCQLSIIYGLLAPVQQHRPEISHHRRGGHPFRTQQQEAAGFTLHRPAPRESLCRDSPHGAGRHGAACHRRFERRTVATCPPGPCHHLRPQVVILDEPSTYIDKHFEARLYELLAEINKDCAIILVSHDIGTVLQQVKSIACVNETLDYHPIPALRKNGWNATSTAR